MKLLKILVLFWALFFSPILNAQLTVDASTYTATQLVEDILMGGGVTVSNVQFYGVMGVSGRYQLSYFTTTGTTETEMGITSGILMTSGDVYEIPGAPDGGQAGRSYSSGTTGEVTGDPDATILASGGYNTDVAILEFDFIPTSDSIRFNYVFGSEEYDELYYDGLGETNYQCSDYNDQFGFLLSGPGISGVFSNSAENIALLTNGSQVCINSVNSGVVGSSGGAPNASKCLAENPDWVNGAFTNEFQGEIVGVKFDGNTKVLTASASVTAGATYHIKLLVADVTDGTYDSGVFLEQGSFIAVDPVCTNPEITNPGPASACGSYTLPVQSSIGGTNLVDPRYYDNTQASGGNEITDLTITSTQTIYIYDADGSCSDEESFTVTINNNPTPSISGDLSYCQGSSTTLDAGAYSSYLWTGGSSNQTLVVSSAGTYSVTVTDANGCSGTNNVTVSTNSNPNPSITGTLSFCSGSNTTLDAGSFSSYSWTGGSSNQTLDVSAGGDYYVTVTDANGCSGSNMVTVSENSNPSPSISGTLSFCSGNSTTLDAGVFSSYLWTGGSSNQTLVVTAGGDYYVTVTDANGCSGTTSASVTENSTLSPSISGTFEFCEGGSTELDAGVFTSYNWTGGTSEQTLTVTSAGDYYVTVSDVNGCTGSDMVTVTENANPAPSISGLLSFCTGNSTTLDAGSYSSYLWTGGSTNQTLVVSAGGDYSVTVTDANGCVGSTTETVSENANLTPSITGDLEYCQGDSTLLDAGTGYDTYTWSNSASIQTTYATSPGTYTITVTDVNGCSGTDNVVIVENPVPTVSISGDLEFCSGSSVTLDAGSYSSYLWTGGSTNQTLDVTTGGDYSVSVTDSNGCSGEQSVSVTENANPEPEITGTLEICEGSTTTLNAGSGFGGYSWSNGSGQPSTVVNTEGSYSVTVTGPNGCTGSDTVYVTVNENPVPEITGVLGFCEGDSTTLSVGIFDVTNWSSGSSENQIYAASPGNYSVTVTDVNGCSGTDEVTVVESSAPDVEITGDLQFCFGDTAMLDAGVGYNDYSWSNGDNTQQIFVTEAGTYVVTVTNDYGCTGTNFVKISTNPSPYPEITGELNICYGESTTLFSGGTYVDYEWSTGSTDSTITVNTAGNYSVTITGTHGCKGYASATVVIYEDLLLDAGITNATCPGDADGSINIDLSGGTEPYSFEWSNSSDQLNQVSLLPGNYTISVTDINGCEKSADFLLISDDKDCLDIPNAFSPNGDLTNDTWAIENIQLYEKIHIEIYNRWGQLMFEFSGTGDKYNDSKYQWDGTYNGNELPISSYVYILDLNNDKEPINGIVTIKR